MTAGQLVEHFSQLAPTDKVRMVLDDDEYPIDHIQDCNIRNNESHPYQDAYNLLGELHEFTGTKAVMLKMISNYFEE